MDEFRELLRSHLSERGALARLAETSGIASHVIGRWRDGRGRPTDGNLRKIAPALGYTYEDLARMCGYLDGEPRKMDQAERELETRAEEFKRGLRGIPRVFWAVATNASVMLAETLPEAVSPVTSPDSAPVTQPDQTGNNGTAGPASDLPFCKHHSARRVLAPV